MPAAGYAYAIHPRMIDQSLKRRIFVNAQDDLFVQCVTQILHLLNKGWWAVPTLRKNKLFGLQFSQQDGGARSEGLLQYAPTRNPAVRKAAENSSNYNTNPNVRHLVTETEQFPILNDSEDILILVDEAHRTQASRLHANLMRALPNCAKIGFTGTPILVGECASRTQAYL